jgi:hypothetical protein
MQRNANSSDVKASNRLFHGSPCRHSNASLQAVAITSATHARRMLQSSADIYTPKANKAGQSVLRFASGTQKHNKVATRCHPKKPLGSIDHNLTTTATTTSNTTSISNQPVVCKQAWSVVCWHAR